MLTCVLLMTSSLSEGGHHTLNHLLWEQDLNHTAVAASQADTSVPQSERLQHEKVRHWSDAYRLPQQFAALEPNKQYDLVIASDCLYFLCQEESLAASIYARVRKPNGKALVVFQPRSTTGQGKFKACTPKQPSHVLPCGREDTGGVPR